MEQDLIYVGGGNTKSMLALWREWDLQNILRKVYAKADISRAERWGNLLVRARHYRLNTREIETAHLSRHLTGQLLPAL